MNVRQKKVDDLNLTVTIKLEKEDWAEARKKKLNEFRRTAEMFPRPHNPLRIRLQ